MSPTRGKVRRLGFTMIEIIAVLVLMGIVSAVVFSVMNRNTQNLIAESEKLSSHIRYMTMRALGDVESWQLSWLTSGTYQVSPVSGGAVRLPGEGGTTASLASGVTSDQVDLRIDQWGRPVNGSDSPLASIATITLDDGNTTRQIQVSPGTSYTQ